MPKHSETDMQRALALVQANRGNISAAAREMGISRSVISAWVNGSRRGKDVEKARVEGVNLGDAIEAEKFGRIVHTYADRLLEPDVIAKTGARDAAIIMGVAADKKRAVLGKPESHREVQHIVTYAEPGTFRNYVRGLQDAQERGLPPEPYTINVPALPAGDDDAADEETIPRSEPPWVNEHLAQIKALEEFRDAQASLPQIPHAES